MKLRYMAPRLKEFSAGTFSIVSGKSAGACKTSCV